MAKSAAQPHPATNYLQRNNANARNIAGAELRQREEREEIVRPQAPAQPRSVQPEPQMATATRADRTSAFVLNLTPTTIR